MNLAICSAGELFGGVERQILDLCQYQTSQENKKPTVVLFFDAELAKQLRESGIEPFILKGRNRYDLSLVAQFVDVLRRNEINVVHAHGYKATIVASLAKRRLKIGLVKTEHGKVESNIRKPLLWLKSQLNFRVEQILTKKFVDVVCYVTDDIRSFFDQTHQGLARHTVYNGIVSPDKESRVRPPDLPDSVVNIGLVGRISEVKGIPIAIQAMKMLTTEKSVLLSIIGTGKLIPELKEMTAKLGLNDRIQFLGFRRNIYDYLAHLDVLIMPSYHEGLPYTLLEAMSFAKPIVASRVGGLAEVIEDGHTGLLFPAGDAPGLAACLNNIIERIETDLDLGANAQKVQANKYTLQAMGARYAEIYSQSALIVESKGVHCE